MSDKSRWEHRRAGLDGSRPVRNRCRPPCGLENGEKACIGNILSLFCPVFRASSYVWSILTVFPGGVATRKGPRSLRP